MGQYPRHLDYPHIKRPLLSKGRWIGKYVEVGICKTCEQIPIVVVLDAEYEGVGGTINKGKFSRVQVYCKDLCEFNVYTPLEGPTVLNVVGFWNYLSNSTYKKIQIELNTNRPEGY